MEVRRAGVEDLDRLTDLLTEAFGGDPLWRWAFPEQRDLRAWWRFCVGSALRYPWVWVAGDFEAASVWIPPDGEELTEGEEAQVEPLLRGLIGDRTSDVLELLERFGQSHPRRQPHYYLSLLGVADRCRGRGIGMSLLAENLGRIDAEGSAAFLESSNPANNARYGQAGFVRVGEFKTPDNARTVATMWRSPQQRSA
ncbi:MAG: GNAT family N-acetyltransferase [Solirubrobacterales bacterium]